MYNKEEELSEKLAKLEKLLRRTILNSKEFKEIKRKIEDKDLEIQVLLMVMARESLRKNKKDKKIFKLTAKDKEFLKKHGIKW